MDGQLFPFSQRKVELSLSSLPLSDKRQKPIRERGQSLNCLTSCRTLRQPINALHSKLTVQAYWEYIVTPSTGTELNASVTESWLETVSTNQKNVKASGVVKVQNSFSKPLLLSQLIVQYSIFYHSIAVYHSIALSIILLWFLCVCSW